MSIRIKENYYKVVWRWYLAPIRLNQIDKKYSKQCWRGCQEIGTYIHMWWSCKYVQKFWENVFKEIKGITKTEIIGTPEIALLSFMDNIQISKELKELIANLVTAARLLKAKKWKGREELLNM
uniref:Reverse transcriptase zinc-binding domain-containing protein n=1 Tax=Anolis carolinensis TaxID=28377 RepID=A0A803T4M9_ANOCA